MKCSAIVEGTGTNKLDFYIRKEFLVVHVDTRLRKAYHKAFVNLSAIVVESNGQGWVDPSVYNRCDVGRSVATVYHDA